MTHSDTIGTITYDGRTYEVDWPLSITDLTRREDYACIYLEGEFVAEFTNPNWAQGFRDAEHVLALAETFMQLGDDR